MILGGGNLGLKTKIKNDLWHINYIIPFTAKYLQFGKVGYIKRAIPTITKLKVIKGKGKRDVSLDIVALMYKIKLSTLPQTSFFYWIDEYKTIAVKGNVLSNFSLDYDRLINGSFHELANQAIAVGGIYGKRAKNVKTAIEILRSRVIETIKAENDLSEEKKITLEEMKNLLERPASHFHEGLQRILFFNQYMWQTRHGLNGLGRLDKILGGLYRNDIDAGVITKKEAYVMICDFMNVLSNWYIYKSSSLLGDIGQIIVIGGLETDGTYFYNDLSYMFLRTQAALKKPDPKVLLRVSNSMPDELLETAIKTLEFGTGSPLFSNDDVVIPKLKQFGIENRDAHQYCVSACWEPFIPGKSLDQNNIKAFDYFKVLDKTMNENDLTKIDTFVQIVSLYENFLRKEWRNFLKSLNEFKWACDPFVSMLTDGCNETGKDISEGGAIHSNYGITTIGMGSAIDTLFNIKQLVFDNKKFSLIELNRLRRNNFKGNEDVFKMLKNMRCWFAHDDPDVERLVNRIIFVSNEEVCKYINPFGGKVKFGLSSPFYIRNAKKIPADLAGRRNGEPYGTHISCLDAPYTEVVNFASKLNYGGHAFNGNVIDYFVSPGLISSNRQKFLIFMKAAIKMGFFQMQMNVVDSSTLIDAKSYPDKYPGLIVRVWGFSAYFNDLPNDYKDLLIRRAIQSEQVA